jgi:mannose-6-phosphate isomerase-like protein (cupin superfamily)
MTDTVDYITILSGEIWLVLDTGVEVHLTPGDCVVQNGTRHAWHNRTPDPCVFVGVQVGATRQD